MKRLIPIFLLVAIVVTSGTLLTKRAEAKTMTRPCAEWQPNEIDAVNHGATITNITQNSGGVYITCQITCTVYPDGGGIPYTTTQTHVYHYPPA